MLTTIEDRGSVRTLTFNRPDALNAFNDAMRDEVTTEILKASSDDRIKVLVITGAGRADRHAGERVLGDRCRSDAQRAKFVE